MTPTTATRLAVVRHVLPNGLVLLSKEARTVPAVTVQVSVRAGGIYDGHERAGTGHLLGCLLDRGTRQRTASSLADVFDARGVTLSVRTTRHLMTIACTCLSEDLVAMIELLAEIVTEPALPDEELAARRGEVLTALRQEEDNPASRVMRSLHALLYPHPHPYGWPVKGSLDTVPRIGREDLIALHAARFAPSTVTAIVVGDVSAADAVAAIERTFGRWRGTAVPEAPLLPPPPNRMRREHVIPMMHKSQVDIAYGFTTIARNDPMHAAYTLMNTALGQYGLGGRLGDSLRERQGLAYMVFSVFDPQLIAGPLVIRAGVDAAHVTRAIRSIDDEVRRLAAKGLGIRELADCKRFVVGSMPRLLETNAAIASFLEMVEFFDLGEDYDERLAAAVDAVTRDDVVTAARRTLDVGAAQIVTAGPYAGRPSRPS